MKPLTTLFTLTLLLIPVYVFALDPIVPCDGPDCQTCHVVQLGQNILTWLISIVAIIIAIVFVIGGLKMVMAAGNETQVTNARSMMTNAIIGFVILLAAWLIVDTVMKYFVKDGALLGPWNQIECVSQPVFVARSTWGGRGSSENWDTEVSNDTTLQKMSMSDNNLWGMELDPDRPNYPNTTNPGVWNYNPEGTSIPFIVPDIPQDYGLAITAFLTNGVNRSFEAVVSTERNFGGEIIGQKSPSSGPDAFVYGVRFMPEDAGKVVYYNYRAEPESGYPWSVVLHMYFKPIDSLPFATLDPEPETPIVTLSGEKKTWSFGEPFPGPNFTRVGFAPVPSDGYVSYRFETGNALDDGGVANFQANGTSGGLLMAISETSGNFNVDSTCKSSGRDRAIMWDTTRTSSTACQLKLNTTYYWNITFTDGVNPASTDCSSDCYAGLVINNDDFGR